MSVPTITLNNGVEIPQLGFGVYQVPPADTKDAVLTAFEVGYRHVDTAQMYGNEAGVGEALKASGLAREDVFVTSKLNNSNHAREDALRSFDETLDKLGGTYVDLFLVHWPLPGTAVDYVDTWRAMEEIAASGNVRAIGVSNFQPDHLDRVLEVAQVVPAVNQVEVHPYLTNEAVRAYDRDKGIATEAWSPIAQGQVLDDPAITEVAGRVGRTPAQVVLRWHVQRGDIIFPKSVTRARVEENFAIFDFELDDAAMDAITALDKGHRTGPDPDTFTWIP